MPLTRRLLLSIAYLKGGEKMTEIPKALTLEEIKDKFQMRREEFHLDNGGISVSSVYRDSEGKIVYVVPRSTEWIVEPPRKRGGDANV